MAPMGANAARSSWAGAIPGVLLLAALALGFYATSPLSGQFWWSDSPRHGLNGIFLAEVLRQAPFDDPRGFAYEFYGRYPALTILFYPPLFYMLSAPAFLLLGESHAVAQAMVALHLLGLVCGVYVLSRTWLDRPHALAAAMLSLGMPEVALWGRQLMLDIPALAFLVWGAVFTLRFGRQGGTCSLAAAVLLTVAALYTKINMAFAVPALVLYLLLARRSRLVADRRVWAAAVLGAAGLVPLIVLTLQFGQANMQSVMAMPDAEAARAALTGWTWYAVRLPETAGPVVLLLAFVGVLVSLRDRGIAGAERSLLPMWFLVVYVALSLVALKETRHGLLLMVPLAVWAAFGLRCLGQFIPNTLRAPAAMVVALTVALHALWAGPVPMVTGYREAARMAAAAAPQQGIVLFSGMRDGSFIFNIRTATGRHDLTTIRADKLFLSVAVRRDLGVRETSYTDAEILALLRELGVSVVVAQRDFWTDLSQMAALQRVIDGPDFEELGRIDVVANVPAEDRELRIYRVRGEVAPARRPMIIDLPIIGRSIPTRIGGD